MLVSIKIENLDVDVITARSELKEIPSRVMVAVVDAIRENLEMDGVILLHVDLKIEADQKIIAY